MCYRKGHSFSKKFTSLLSRVPLGRYEKDVILDRYLDMVIETERVYAKNHILYVMLAIAVSTAGAVIAVVQTINQSQMSADQITTIGLVAYWSSLALSILVAVGSGALYMFNIHKKAVINNTTLENLYSEGWIFLQGNDIYKHCQDYTERYLLFTSRIEHIRTSSVKRITALEEDTIAGATMQDPPRTARKSKREHHKKQENADDAEKDNIDDSDEETKHTKISIDK